MPQRSRRSRSGDEPGSDGSGGATRSGGKRKEIDGVEQPESPTLEPVSAVSPSDLGQPMVMYTPNYYIGQPGSSTTPVYDSVPLSNEDYPSAASSMHAALYQTEGDIVRLSANGLPDVLPRIGDVEAAFFAGGRVQRKIWRIELRQGRALIDVERSDAARCLGIVALGTV